MIPQGNIPSPILRAAWLFVTAILVPPAIMLTFTSPPSAINGMGVFLLLGSGTFLFFWWTERPRPVDRVAIRLVYIGSALAFVSIGLVEGGLILFMNRYPDDPLSAFVPAISVGGAGVLCLIARIVVGIRTLALRRMPADAPPQP